MFNTSANLNLHFVRQSQNARQPDRGKLGSSFKLTFFFTFQGGLSYGKNNIAILITKYQMVFVVAQSSNVCAITLLKRFKIIFKAFIRNSTI